MDKEQIETPMRVQVEAAIDRGDADGAKRLLASMERDWLRNKDYSINWITSLLSFIGRRLGEGAVEDALRDFGDRFLRDRRAGQSAATPEQRLEGLVRAMKANGADVSMAEDGEKYIASFRCGSGGMLIDSGAYGSPLRVLSGHKKGRAPFRWQQMAVNGRIPQFLIPERSTY